MKPRQELEQLKRQAVKGRQFENMMTTEGWKILEQEINKMLEAFRDQGVSKELMGDVAKHAAVVGGYNALKSLLSLTRQQVDWGKKADAKADELEKQIREREREERQLRRI